MATQLEILQALRGTEGGMKMSELSEALGEEPSALAKPVKALKEKGQVTKHDDLYYLTPKGSVPSARWKSWSIKRIQAVILRKQGASWIGQPNFPGFLKTTEFQKQSVS